MPKFISKSDPAAQWTGAHKGHAFFAYANNYLIDLKVAIIVDVEATRAIRQAEVGAARTMIERTEERLELCPERLAADSAYGSAEMLGWLVNERAIEPHPLLGNGTAGAMPSQGPSGGSPRFFRAYDRVTSDYLPSSDSSSIRIGETVLYRGARYSLQGISPSSLPARLAELQDLATGHPLVVPLDEVAADNY